MIATEDTGPLREALAAAEAEIERLCQLNDQLTYRLQAWTDVGAEAEITELRQRVETAEAAKAERALLSAALDIWAERNGLQALVMQLQQRLEQAEQRAAVAEDCAVKSAEACFAVADERDQIRPQVAELAEALRRARGALMSVSPILFADRIAAIDAALAKVEVPRA